MLPLYMLRRLTEASGRRLPKLIPWKPPQEVAGTCPTCSKAVLYMIIVGQKQVDGRWIKGEYYHYRCAPMSGYHSETSMWNVKAGNGKGNIGQEEYRYWIGTQASVADSKYAMCRCCRKSTYGREERNAHFEDPESLVNGDPCSTRLVKAYKRLLSLPTCIVCKQDRYRHEKWGIPLCAKPECELAWKFETKRYIVLEAVLQEDHRKNKQQTMVSIQKPDPDVVICSVTDSKGITVWRPYCNRCRMFADNRNHEDIHKAWNRVDDVKRLN